MQPRDPEPEVDPRCRCCLHVWVAFAKGPQSVSRRAFLLGGAALAAGAPGALRVAGGAGTRTSGHAGARRASTNQYLAGNFAPVAMEADARDLTVHGAIPRELSGWLLRIGPDPIAATPGSYHWFLGDGMVHAIELRDGRAVSYRNRWVRTDTAAALLGGTRLPGQPREVNPAPNAANTSLVAQAGRLLALYEVSLPTEITPELATVGRFDFAGGLRSPMTAHPKLDPVTGELLFFGLDLFGPPYLRFHVADAAGHLARTHEVVLPAPSMMHDFAITERHVVFLDMPVVYDFALIGHRPFPARWKPENGARVGVMSRDASGGVEWLDVELGYVFHTLNAYDDGDRVVLDLVRHPKMFDRDVYGVADGRGTLQRWTIDPGARRVREEQVSGRVQEFPRVDPRRLGRRHRYGYTTLTSDTGRGQRLGFGSPVKHDLRTGHAEVARLGPAAAASEGIFVPASEQAGEDEGWVLAVVYDARRDGSDLVVLDATNFTGRPVARVRLPQRVPFGFHGIWLPSSR